MSFEQFEDRREAFIQKYVSSEPTHVGTDIKPWLVFDQRVFDRQAQQPDLQRQFGPIWKGHVPKSGSCLDVKIYETRCYS